MGIVASHYSGCGNNFLIIDDRLELFPKNDAELISELCLQADVDGLILVQNSSIASFRMRFFNNDGTEASMCGNGIRCMMRFIVDKIDSKTRSCHIETQKGQLLVKMKGDLVEVEMGKVEEIDWNLMLDYEGEERVMHHLNTGVPHLVTFVDDVNSIDVENVGSYFRHLKNANVNFVDKVRGEIRTFERGVEGETLACGTGATAAAYALHKLYDFSSPITLKVRSQALLEISIENNFAHLTGPATWIGDITLDCHNACFCN